MIITLTDAEINVDSDNFCCTLSNETLNKLSWGRLMRKRNTSYKLFINNHELRLVCPMLKNGQHKNIVLWPAFKLPFRKYPVYVYLYAVALYLSSDLSMRDTAAYVRNKFGLDKFSHSTVSRALKKLSEIADTLVNIITISGQMAEKSSGLVIRKNWDNTRRDKYSLLLQILFPVLDKNQTILYGSYLNYKYFNHSLKFVI